MDLLPHHFYSEIPDIAELKKNRTWKEPFSLIGVDGADLKQQLEFVRECCELWVDDQKTAHPYAHACSKNGAPGFGPIEADFLHCFIRSQKPGRIVQVGCGVSTAVILSAAKAAGYRPEIVCVEPYPNSFLLDSDRSGEIKLVAKKAENLGLDIFLELGKNGLLFVDSTHTVKPGSEVSRLILEILPRLRKMSWVHFHDIYFPYDYSRRLLTEDVFFPHESVLLHAFLVNNRKFTIKACLSMLHYSKSSELGLFFPNYKPSQNDHGLEISKGHFPSSIYLQAAE